MLISLLEGFWKKIEKDDNKRISAQALPENVHEDNNIPYLDDGSSAHMLDVYYPEGAAAPLPVIIDIHGGGWMYGTKELNKNYCLYLAARGYVVFNMSYRLVPEVTMPRQLEDISYALIKISQLLDEYPCDKAHIYLTGDSAGGHLAAFTACIQGSSKLRELFNFKANNMAFAAVGLTSPVAFLAPGGIVEVYTRLMTSSEDKARLGKYLNLDALLEEARIPPTYLVTSSGDVVARAQTHRAYNAIVKSGAHAKIVDWKKTNGKNLPHVFSVLEPMSEEGAKSIDDMLEFFLRHSVEVLAAVK